MNLPGPVFGIPSRPEARIPRYDFKVQSPAHSFPAPKASESSVAARVLYRAAIVGCLVLGTLASLAVIAQLPIPMIVPALLAAAVGIAVADFITGAVHWACDTWGSVDTPWLGKGLIFSFREHHKTPLAMLDHDTIDINGGAASAAFAALLGFTVLKTVGSAEASTSLETVFDAFFISLVLTSAGANQLHSWAHTTRAPRWVRWLQARDLILSPAAHAQHHRAPHHHSYCISTGWLNRPLDAMGFWRAAEMVLTKITGFQPRQDQGRP